MTRKYAVTRLARHPECLFLAGCCPSPARIRRTAYAAFQPLNYQSVVGLRGSRQPPPPAETRILVAGLSRTFSELFDGPRLTT